MTWTAEKTFALLTMKEARKTNRHIGDALGFTEGAVAMQYGRLRAAMRGDRKGERWTEEENAALIAAGEKGEDWGEVGPRLQRTGDACKVQFNMLKRGGSRKEARASVQRVARQAATALAKEIRDAAPQHRSITAEFCGDPLPGRSALDKRGQSDGVRSVSLAGSQS